MKRFLPALCGLLILSSATTCLGRSWTNSEGKAIQADYVSHADGKVVLKMNGREISYEIEKLSAEDQEFLKTVKATASEEIITGHRKDLPISHRLFPEVDDYYRDRDRRSMRKALESGAEDDQEIYLKGNFDEWIKRDPALDTYQIYVPPSYDGTKPYGLLIYVNPGYPHNLPSEWFPLFDSFKLIAVAADNVGNDKTMPRRIQTSMDALATAEKLYQIDPERRVVTGLSGGGHMAMVIAANYPDYFIGAVSHAAQSYLPSAAGYGHGHFPGFTLDDFTSSKRKHLKWIVVSGDKDFNYQAILDTSKKWDENKLQYRFLDVPGMGHQHSEPGPLKEALLWVGLKEMP